MVSLLRGLVLAFAIVALGGTAMAADLENTLYIDVPDGRVVIAMRPDLAPGHVAQIKALARRGFYDGVPFHRVIDGFMAQTGDPTGTGTGGSGNKLKAEFSNEKHVRGTVSMARAQDPNSADSQFFIVLRAGPVPRRAIHDLGRGHLRHGAHRRDQEGRPGAQRHGQQPGQDHPHAGRGGRGEGEVSRLRDSTSVPKQFHAPQVECRRHEILPQSAKAATGILSSLPVI